MQCAEENEGDRSNIELTAMAVSTSMMFEHLRRPGGHQCNHINIKCHCMRTAVQLTASALQHDLHASGEL